MNRQGHGSTTLPDPFSSSEKHKVQPLGTVTHAERQRILNAVGEAYAAKGYPSSPCPTHDVPAVVGRCLAFQSYDPLLRAEQLNAVMSILSPHLEAYGAAVSPTQLAEAVIQSGQVC